MPVARCTVDLVLLAFTRRHDTMDSFLTQLFIHSYFLPFFDMCRKVERVPSGQDPVLIAMAREVWLACWLDCEKVGVPKKAGERKKPQIPSKKMSQRRMGARPP